MSDALLQARGLAKTYASGRTRLQVLSNLDLTVVAGEAVAIVGQSGVGKSTLLHLLGGLDRPDAGRLEFRGRPVPNQLGDALAEYRNRHVGFVFQLHHLLPEFTALENVVMPFRIGRRSAEARPAADELLRELGLADRLHHRPAELSGGEQQRVALARAVVAGPDLVLADEPTGNLDPATGRQVFEVLRRLQRERGFALILATHSAQLAVGCDRVLRLEDGHLVGLDRGAAREYFNELGGHVG
jgi:lipoprotein-releasing system ATP-binding protein